MNKKNVASEEEDISFIAALIKKDAKKRKLKFEKYGVSAYTNSSSNNERFLI